VRNYKKYVICCKKIKKIRLRVDLKVSLCILNSSCDVNSEFQLKPGDLCAEKRVQVIEITLLIRIFLHCDP
jgi:hypothetical protein